MPEVYSKKQEESVYSVINSLAKNMNKDSPESMATKLFSITADYFQKYDMDNPESHQQTMKAMEKARAATHDQILASVLNAHTAEKMSSNIIYWSNTMDNLLKKGDFTTAATVRLAISEIYSKKDPNVKNAIAALPMETKNIIDGYRVSKLDTLIKTYQDPKREHVTIPFIGMYAAALDLAKNAASLQDDPEKRKQENPGITNLRELTATVKNRLCIRLLDDLIEKSIEYNKLYKDSKNSIDQRKHDASQILLNFMQDDLLSTEQRMDFLQNFIEKAPQGLQHKSFLNRLGGGDFTIVKIAQEMLPLMQSLAMYEATTANNLRQPVPAEEMSTPLVKEQEGAKEEIKEQATEGIEQKSPAPHNRKESTAEVFLDFKGKIKYFEDEIKRNSNDDIPRGPKT